MLKTHTRRLVYVPHLHRESAPACLPQVVQFLSVGLTDRKDKNDDKQA